MHIRGPISHLSQNFTAGLKPVAKQKHNDLGLPLFALIPSG
jgi:hypothetical protein